MAGLAHIQGLSAKETPSPALGSNRDFGEGTQPCFTSSCLGVRPSGGRTSLGLMVCPRYQADGASSQLRLQSHRN